MTGGVSNKYPTPAIWKYGDVELHFTHPPEEALALVYYEGEEEADTIAIRN